MSKKYYGGRVPQNELSDVCCALAIARTSHGFDIYVDGDDHNYCCASNLAIDRAREVLGALKVRDIEGMSPSRLVGIMVPDGRTYRFEVTCTRKSLRNLLEPGSSEELPEDQPPVAASLANDAADEEASEDEDHDAEELYEYFFAIQGTKYEGKELEEIKEAVMQDIGNLEIEIQEIDEEVVVFVSSPSNADTFLQDALGQLYSGDPDDFSVEELDEEDDI